LPNALPYDETNLLRRVSVGDENAFRQLIKIYFNRLASYIMAFTGSKPLTEEIVQDVLIKVWQNRFELSQITRFDAWLFVIARNHTYNVLVQLSREKQRREKWEREVISHLHDDNELPVNRYQQRLDEAIARLSPQQRHIYIMSRREGLSSAEISQKTGLSIDTIKKHRSLAIKKIKAHLKKMMIFFFQTSTFCMTALSYL
jgi:RNA polymerase sigma factor, sigma-70 family